MKWSLISPPHFIRIMLLSSGLFFGQILMRHFKIYWQKWKLYPVHFTFVAYSSGDEQTILGEISILKYCANYVKILSVVYAFFKISNTSVICFFQSSEITKFLFSWVSIGLHRTKTKCYVLMMYSGLMFWPRTVNTVEARSNVQILKKTLFLVFRQGLNHYYCSVFLAVGQFPSAKNWNLTQWFPIPAENVFKKFK